MKVCVETSFAAAHFLPGHSKCGHIHGHTYKVRATIDGKIGDNGMVVDFGKVKHALRLWDHDSLNFNEARDQKIEYYIPRKQKVLLFPTVENLALFFVEELIELGSFETVEVTVWETDACSATVKKLGVKH